MAEGGGLLNRYRVKSSIGGSNPPLSAINTSEDILVITQYPQLKLGYLSFGRQAGDAGRWYGISDAL